MEGLEWINTLPEAAQRGLVALYFVGLFALWLVLARLIQRWADRQAQHRGHHISFGEPSARHLLDEIDEAQRQAVGKRVRQVVQDKAKRASRQVPTFLNLADHPAEVSQVYLDDTPVATTPPEPERAPEVTEAPGSLISNGSWFGVPTGALTMHTVCKYLKHGELREVFETVGAGLSITSLDVDAAGTLLVTIEGRRLNWLRPGALVELSQWIDGRRVVVGPRLKPQQVSVRDSYDDAPDMFTATFTAELEQS